MYIAQKSAELAIQEQDAIHMVERKERILTENSQLSVSLKFILFFSKYVILFPFFL